MASSEAVGMTGRRGDPRIGMMAVAFGAIINSLPNVMDPEEHGPLSLDEIDEAAALMNRLAAEVERERAGDS